MCVYFLTKVTIKTSKTVRKEICEIVHNEISGEMYTNRFRKQFNMRPDFFIFNWELQAKNRVLLRTLRRQKSRSGD